jgi:hypothetical protein
MKRTTTHARFKLGSSGWVISLVPFRSSRIKEAEAKRFWKIPYLQTITVTKRWWKWGISLLIFSKLCRQIGLSKMWQITVDNFFYKCDHSVIFLCYFLSTNLCHKKFHRNVTFCLTNFCLHNSDCWKILCVWVSDNSPDYYY